MRLAIFGGTGGTGQHIVAQALAAGHEVVALARTPSKFTTQDDKLTIVPGDVLQADCVAQVVAGSDAVISALAPPNNKPEFIISQGMDNILAAMQTHDVQRLVITAGAGVRMPQDKPGMIDHIFGFLLKRISANVVADMEQVVHKVMASDREWVVGRAPRLTNQPGTGQITAGYVGTEGLGTALSREDFARFILAQVDSDTWLREAPALSN